MSGRLVVCPTPIGNLEDITLRVISALRSVDLIACEDTRRTGQLLKHLEITTPMISFHDHNERARAPELVERMRGGAVLALVSDAGMPSVNDPGYILLRTCAEEGVRIEVLPGPSAVLTALVASALPADTWRFVGFLPRKKAALEGVFASGETVVAFESPNRAAKSLEVLAALDPERPVVLCRELTKLHEEVVRGTAAKLAARFKAHPPRGEVVIVVAPTEASSSALHEKAAIAAVARLVEAGAKPRTAAAVVAKLTGSSANTLYRAVEVGRASEPD